VCASKKRIGGKIRTITRSMIDRTELNISEEFAVQKSKRLMMEKMEY